MKTCTKCKESKDESRIFSLQEARTAFTGFDALCTATYGKNGLSLDNKEEIRRKRAEHKPEQDAYNKRYYEDKNG